MRKIKSITAIRKKKEHCLFKIGSWEFYSNGNILVTPTNDEERIFFEQLVKADEERVERLCK